MAKINPKTARAMYEATVQGNKDKIAKETYGEFGFDTLTYDQQQEVYKKYPKLPRSSKDIGSDFETPAKMKSPLYVEIEFDSHDYTATVNEYGQLERFLSDKNESFKIVNVIGHINQRFVDELNRISRFGMSRNTTAKGSPKLQLA